MQTKNNGMKKYLFFAMIFFVGLSSFGKLQQPDVNGGIGNLQGLKIAFITKQLALSPDEAQKFWPVYYNYNDEFVTVKKEKKDDVLAAEEGVLNVKKRYFAEFKKILGSDQRANKVFLTDREFGEFIKKEMENRQKLRAQRQQNKLNQR